MVVVTTVVSLLVCFVLFSFCSAQDLTQCLALLDERAGPQSYTFSPTKAIPDAFPVQAKEIAQGHSALSSLPSAIFQNVAILKYFKMQGYCYSGTARPTDQVTTAVEKKLLIIRMDTTTGSMMVNQEAEENMNKSFYCGFHGKELPRFANGLGVPPRIHVVEALPPG